jgi:hypothetical protein
VLKNEYTKWKVNIWMVITNDITFDSGTTIVFYTFKGETINMTGTATFSELAYDNGTAEEFCNFLENEILSNVNNASARYEVVNV